MQPPKRLQAFLHSPSASSITHSANSALAVDGGSVRLTSPFPQKTDSSPRISHRGPAINTIPKEQSQPFASTTPPTPVPATQPIFQDTLICHLLQQTFPEPRDCARTRVPPSTHTAELPAHLRTAPPGPAQGPSLLEKSPSGFGGQSWGKAVCLG